MRPIALPATVAPDLPGDRGVAAPNRRADRPEALPTRQPTRDLLAVLLRQLPLRTLPRRRPQPARRSHVATNVLVPDTELAPNRPPRHPGPPQLPHPLLLALGEPKPFHDGDRLHSPSSQASRPDVQVVR